MYLRIIFGIIYNHFQGSGNLDAIQIIKKLGGNLVDSYLDEGNTSSSLNYNLIHDAKRKDMPYQVVTFNFWMWYLELFFPSFLKTH